MQCSGLKQSDVPVTIFRLRDLPDDGGEDDARLKIENCEKKREAAVGEGGRERECVTPAGDDEWQDRIERERERQRRGANARDEPSQES